MTTKTPTPEPLRCDRCGANPYPSGSRAAHKDGRVIIFCGHHATEHVPALEKQKLWTITPIIPPDPQSGVVVTTSCGVCEKPAKSRPVKATPASVAVDIVQCPRCDVRQCAHLTNGVKCGRFVPNPQDPICAGGHTLMAEAS